MNRKNLLLIAMVLSLLSLQPAQGNDGRIPWGLSLLPAVTPVQEQIIQFHNLLLPIILGISGLVLLLILYVALRFNAKRNPRPATFAHNTLIEVIWTAVPVLILLVIVVPSFRLLYYSDKDPNAEMTVKVVGHQWYWSYEYPDHGGIAFDSYMIPDDQIDPGKGQQRLLEVDNRLVLPVDTSIRFVTTSADVIHAFAMPSWGVKKDAVPGQLNETWARITREGTYYGQCSEICGTGHAFMPTAVDVVSKEKFAEWVQAKGGRMPIDTNKDAIPERGAGPDASLKKSEKQENK